LSAAALIAKRYLIATRSSPSFSPDGLTPVGAQQKWLKKKGRKWHAGAVLLPKDGEVQMPDFARGRCTYTDLGLRRIDVNSASFQSEFAEINQFIGKPTGPEGGDHRRRASGTFRMVDD
jgi:hypothetical protein